MTARSHTRTARAKRKRMRTRLAEHVVEKKAPKVRKPFDDSISDAVFWGPTIDVEAERKAREARFARR